MSDSSEETLQDALLRWYRAERRVLPWREDPKPYRVWISEIMLQQTRVDTVIGYFERFMTAFPTVEDLAAAPLDDVLAAWSGLGYYSRARNLHAAAKQIAAMDAFPSTAASLRQLTGVGPYTAGAIASIAFGEDAPLVDGNVERVISRWRRIEDDPRSAAGRKKIWAAAAELLATGQAGDWNQALMELGALICSPRNPGCTRCPVERFFVARAAGVADELPKKARKRPPKPIFGVCGALVRGGRVLMVKRPAEGLLAGLWELPGGDTTKDADEGPALAGALRARLGLAATPIRRLGQVEHIFTHRRLQLGVWLLSAEDLPETIAPIDHYQAARWVAPEDLEGLGVPTLTRKSLALFDFGERQQALFAAEP